MVFLLFLSLAVAVTASNVVDVSVFGESLCPDTKRFFQNHLVPTWQALGQTQRLRIEYHPFGKARCTLEDDDYKCSCQHRKQECLVNAEQACVIENSTGFEDYFEKIACIQLNRRSLDCFDTTTTPTLEEVQDCGRSKLGRKLLAEQGDIQKKVIPKIKRVPHIRINGEGNPKAEFEFAKVVCSLLDPVPDECSELFK